MLEDVSREMSGEDNHIRDPYMIDDDIDDGLKLFVHSSPVSSHSL